LPFRDGALRAGADQGDRLAEIHSVGQQLAELSDRLDDQPAAEIIGSLRAGRQRAARACERQEECTKLHGFTSGSNGSEFAGGSADRAANYLEGNYTRLVLH
jgi:hypothetical protein